MSTHDEIAWLGLTLLGLFLGFVIGISIGTETGAEERCEQVFNAAAVSGQALHPSILYVCDYDLPRTP